MSVKESSEDRASKQPLIFDFSSSSSNLLVCFGGIAGGFVIPPFEFLRSSESWDIKKMFVRDISQSWYHCGLPEFADNIDGIASEINNIVRDQKVERAILMGNSMGGYAALLFGSLINADIVHVHAFCPQTFIDRHNRSICSDKRWEKELENVYSSDTRQEQYFDLLPLLKSAESDRTFNVHFDPNDRLDGEHAKRLQDIPNLQLHAWEGYGHGVVKQLRDSGFLRKTINDLLRQ